MLHLSKFIIENNDDYYRLLREVSATGAWNEWIRYMLESVRQTSAWTLERITAAEDLQSETRAQLQTIFGTVNGGLLEVLFEQPYCRIANVIAATGVSRPTASGWLNTLVEYGVLTDFKAGRDRIFVNTRFMDVLAERP